MALRGSRVRSGTAEAAHPAVRDEYLQVKRAALSAPDYAEAKEPWFAEAYPKALAWAEATGWRP